MAAAMSARAARSTASAALRRGLSATCARQAAAQCKELYAWRVLVPELCRTERTTGDSSSNAPFARWRPIAIFAAGALAAAGGSSSSSSCEESLLVRRSSSKDYRLLHKIGKGRYGEVCEGIHNESGDKCAIKTFKSVREDRFKREVEILEKVRGGPNIIELRDIVQDSKSEAPRLVFELVEKQSPKELFPRLSDEEVRYYMYQLVEAVAHCHSQGIMHRDLKPRNVVIDHNDRKLRLIDFGLAEFYRPGQQYSSRVSSLYYKAPELLCGFDRYDCSIDVWSLGCMLAGLVFRKDHFFVGTNDSDQLIKIARVLGTSGLLAYAKKYKLDLGELFPCGLARLPKKPWLQFLNEDNSHLVSVEALDLLDRMLVYDHAARITLEEALEHPFFEAVRQRMDAELVTISFQPGAVGIAAQPSGLITRVDAGGQGGRQGVVAGWHIDSINKQRFSVQLLQQYTSSQHPYTITFRRVKDT